METLYHATTFGVSASIAANGLLTSYSRGARPAVWLCTKARIQWAFLHTVRRHGGRIEDVVVFEVRVPRRLLRRHGNGLWYTLQDVPPEQLRCHATFAMVSASEVVG